LRMFTLISLSGLGKVLLTGNLGKELRLG
jgi:hypothetical protein